jgi:hypothetical protein
MKVSQALAEKLSQRVSQHHYRRFRSRPWWLRERSGLFNRRRLRRRMLHDGRGQAKRLIAELAIGSADTVLADPGALKWGSRG